MYTTTMTSSINTPRIVSRFSCGAASAVATKLALTEFGADRVLILNAFIVEEHADNQRFLNDCQEWFGHPITQLRDEKYGASAQEVWKRKKFLANGMYGAPCSVVLKKNVLDGAALPSDVFVMGYTVDERKRFDRFIDANNERQVVAPLIERKLGKADCLAILQRAGIELPAMYKLGYNNNNCIGCCKGGEGYWNRIRKDFPETFVAVSAIQKQIGPGAYIFRDRKTGQRYSLDDLPPTKGRHKEPEISCSAFCEAAEDDLKDPMED